MGLPYARLLCGRRSKTTRGAADALWPPSISAAYLDDDQQPRMYRRRRHSNRQTDHGPPQQWTTEPCILAFGCPSTVRHGVRWQATGQSDRKLDATLQIPAVLRSTHALRRSGPSTRACSSPSPSPSSSAQSHSADDANLRGSAV